MDCAKVGSSGGWAGTGRRAHRALPWATVVLLLAFVVPAAAQAPTFQLPGPADPGQIERRFEEPLRPRVEPELKLPAAQPGVAPEGAESVRFFLAGIVFDGVTVYGDDELLRLYDQQLGKEISLADVFDIAARVTAKYRADGYVLSRAVVPAQTIRGGIVRLVVVEGFIDRIIIERDDLGTLRRLASQRGITTRLTYWQITLYY